VAESQTQNAANQSGGPDNPPHPAQFRGERSEQDWAERQWALQRERSGDRDEQRQRMARQITDNLGQGGPAVGGVSSIVRRAEDHAFLTLFAGLALGCAIGYFALARR
jgi:hypothetical protein